MRAREGPIIFLWRCSFSWKFPLRSPKSHHFVPEVCHRLHNYCLNVQYFSIPTLPILQHICLHQTLQNLISSSVAPRAASWKPLPNPPPVMTRIIILIALWCVFSVNWTMWIKAFSEYVACSLNTTSQSYPRWGFAMSIVFTPCHLAHTFSYKAS